MRFTMLFHVLVTQSALHGGLQELEISSFHEFSSYFGHTTKASEAQKNLAWGVERTL